MADDEMRAEGGAQGKGRPDEPDTTGGGSADALLVDQAPESEAARRQRRERVLALKRELVGGDLLTAAEVAEILDIHPRTVGEYIREGKLRAFQFGGGWKISENALRAFVRDQTQGPQPSTSAPAAHSIAQALNDVLLTLLPRASKEREASSPGKPSGGRRREMKCSFCGKSQDQVERLIAGPNGVFICSQCVGLCNEIIAEAKMGEA